MTSPSIARRLIVKTAPVISDAELHSPRIKYEIDEDPLGLRVFHGIVHSLLSDAQQIVFNQSRQWPERAIDFNLSLDRRFIRQSPRSLTQGSRQVVVFKSGRAQIPNITSRFGDTMTNLLSGAVQMGPGGLSLGRHCPCHYFKLHRNPRHLLGQVVMNLTGDASSLSQHSAELCPHPAHA